MVNADTLINIVGNFTGTPVAVVGDMMLDRFIWGRVDRISPEAPVPVVRVTRESVHLGGAANVVANLTALGGVSIPVGIVGNDDVGKSTLNLIKELGAGTGRVVVGQDFESIQKTRIIAHQQQVCRVDREGESQLSERDQLSVMKQLLDVMPNVESLIISDYGKGLITKDLLDCLRSRTGLKLFVDPKDRNFANYHHVEAITPNQHEAERLSGIKIRESGDLDLAAQRIFENLSPRQLLITRGEQGMALFDGLSKRVEIPTQAQEVFDVSGAGDTVIATFTLARQSGANSHQAALLANLAAGIVVGKLGTASTCQEELIQAIRAKN